MHVDTSIHCFGVRTTTSKHLFSFYRDRCRTAINVLGDAYGAGLVDHLSRKDLVALDKTDIKKQNSIELNEGFVNGSLPELVGSENKSFTQL